MPPSLSICFAQNLDNSPSQQYRSGGNFGKYLFWESFWQPGWNSKTTRITRNERGRSLQWKLVVWLLVESIIKMKIYLPKQTLQSTQFFRYIFRMFFSLYSCQFWRLLCIYNGKMSYFLQIRTSFCKFWTQLVCSIKSSLKLIFE